MYSLQKICIGKYKQWDILKLVGEYSIVTKLDLKSSQYPIFGTNPDPSKDYIDSDDLQGVSDALLAEL
jgi:hypothetical protein